MKQFFKVTALFTMLIAPLFLHAQNGAVRDVFILIDVSGTMNNSDINSEAQQQIYELLTGCYDKGKWIQKGWTTPPNFDCGLFNNKSSIIVSGSKVCVMPFGNMDRMTERQKMEVTDIPQFESFYNGCFPKEFKDGYTYLTLAKAYVSSVAQSWNINNAYLIIYSDGLGDANSTTKLREIYQELIDAYQKKGGNSYDKVGIIRKSTSKRNYDIEVFNFTTPIGEVPIDTIGKDSVTPPPTISQIKIKNKHAKPSPMSAKVGSEIVISWLGSGQANVSFQKDEKALIGKKLSEYVDYKKEGNSVKVIFNESGNYKITVSDSNSSDSTYVETSSSFPWIILLVIVLIVAGILLIKKVMPQNNKKAGGNHNSSNTGDDW